MAVTSSVYSEEQTRSMGIDEEERSLADGNRQRSIHVHSGSFDFQDSRFSSGIGSPRDSVTRRRGIVSCSVPPREDGIFFYSLYSVLYALLLT